MMESELNIEVNEVDNGAAAKKKVMKQCRKIMRFNQRQRTKEAKIAKNMAKVHEAAEDKRKKEMLKEKMNLSYLQLPRANAVFFQLMQLVY